MKRILILVLIAWLMLPNIQSQNIEIKVIMEKPYLVPGDSDVSLGIVLFNKSDGDLEDIHARLLLSYPFGPSIVTSPVLRSDSFTLRRLEKNTSRQIIFKIDVDRGAGYGDHEVPLTVDYTTDEGSHQESFTIRLHVIGETLVDIDEISMDKDVEVGKEFRVDMKIRNTGKNMIEWLKVSLTLNENSAVVSKESSEKIFKNLKSGASVNVSFRLAARRDIKPDSYIIPILLTYQDEAKEIHQSQETLGVTVLGKAKVDIAGVKMSPEEIFAGDRMTLTIQLDNTGTGDAKAVSGTLAFGPSRFQSYSGEIERGDSGALFFTLTTPEEAGASVTYTLKITYEDDFGAHEYEIPVEIRLEERKDAEEMVVYGGIVAALLFAAMLVWLWRRRVKK